MIVFFFFFQIATSCTNGFCVWAQKPNGTIDSFCSDGNPCNGVEVKMKNFERLKKKKTELMNND